eukprot:1822203-Alexandrium_andersonii.AAC.1
MTVDLGPPGPGPVAADSVAAADGTQDVDDEVMIVDQSGAPVPPSGPSSRRATSSAGPVFSAALRSRREAGKHK